MLKKLPFGQNIIGEQTKMYDIIIIGAGPAGLTAAIYGAQANKNVLVLEKMGAGGQTANINLITNYPGFKEINGFELAENMKAQSTALGATFKREEVVSVSLDGEIKKIKTHKSEYESKAVIIATGAFAKPLDVKNEKEFLGKGLSYCATCDGNFFKDKTVAVVGGGNSSMDDCIYLENIAKKIYVIHRRDEFRATEYLFNKVKTLAKDNGKIEFLTNCVVANLQGENALEAIEVLNKKDGKTNILNVDGLFVAIGRKPDTEIFAGQVELDLNGFVVTDQNMQTNLKNVYAVGDVRNTPLRQIVTACADGAVAVSQFIKNS